VVIGHQCQDIDIGYITEIGMDSVDICDKVRDILEPLGFECYPFKVNSSAAI